MRDGTALSLLMMAPRDCLKFHSFKFLKVFKSIKLSDSHPQVLANLGQKIFCFASVLNEYKKTDYQTCWKNSADTIAYRSAEIFAHTPDKYGFA
jgi:hypothetical protein